MNLGSQERVRTLIQAGHLHVSNSLARIFSNRTDLANALDAIDREKAIANIRKLDYVFERESYPSVVRFQSSYPRSHLFPNIVCPTYLNLSGERFIDNKSVNILLEEACDLGFNYWDEIVYEESIDYVRSKAFELDASTTQALHPVTLVFDQAVQGESGTSLSPPTPVLTDQLLGSAV